MDSGDAHTLTKIAVFCICMSMIVTIMVSVYVNGTGDYDYDTIEYYQSQLYDYTGGQLVNATPWMLTAVYTPATPGAYDTADELKAHTDPDGWLYGSSITGYSYIGEATGVRLDKDYKSNQYLTVGTPYNYDYKVGEETWHDVGDSAIRFLTRGTSGVDDVIAGLKKLGLVNESSRPGYNYYSGTANNWNYTGYRYVFDPMLPFSSGASSKDGTLSIVWYSFDNESGISGGLQIYKNGRTPSTDDTILLAQYSASDIIAGYQSSSGYATTYDFDFDGTHLNLSIGFDYDAVSKYGSLRAAWDEGAWDMAISSASAGNYFDVENSNAFSATAGTAFDTFIQIYTFQYYEFEGEDSWVNIFLWLLIGLPMTMALLLITMRTIGGVFKIF